MPRSGLHTTKGRLGKVCSAVLTGLCTKSRVSEETDESLPSSFLLRPVAASLVISQSFSSDLQKFSETRPDVAGRLQRTAQTAVSEIYTQKKLQ